MKTTNLLAWDGVPVSQATGRKFFEPKLTRNATEMHSCPNCGVVLLLLLLLLLLLDEFSPVLDVFNGFFCRFRLSIFSFCMLVGM